MHYSQTDSGLVLANEAMDEAAVRAALKDYDRDLRLVPQESLALGVVLWKVMRYAGSDRPAELVCVWQSDSGEPYPLSMRILDKVKQLDRNTRSEHLTADERNERRAARERATREAEYESLVDDYRTRVKRDPMLPRSQSLRMSRDKQRARGKKV